MGHSVLPESTNETRIKGNLDVIDCLTSMLCNAGKCGKPLQHYPAFCRNGTTIAIQSFVFVLAKEGSEYIAYLEDMYEGQRGTANTQAISAECINGLAIILSREHFEKFMVGYLPSLLPKTHLCFRQFRHNKIKPFDLDKLRGYFDQLILSCLAAYIFLTTSAKAFNADANIVRGNERARNFGGQQCILKVHSGAEHWKKIAYEPLCQDIKYYMSSRRLFTFKNVDFNKCWGWMDVATLRNGFQISVCNVLDDLQSGCALPTQMQHTLPMKLGLRYPPGGVMDGGKASLQE
ncbi:hypothetical protein Nepgr_003297 [Nepenthes gracilis]|uniref:Uncharacterized protein n=1 Tax=Nepenthes gracilis TaxID=150966 RepID=A0AAD3RZA3_NEPGR|nr:hypothetical protein Nepgr_003297 [Nepenthes gracilis]